jgi:hypothetical protein
VPGLEHTLAWKPSGGLIISTQRFGGFIGAGVGKEGKHKVIFFEKNGLRRGDFEITYAQNPKGVATERKWGYRIKEVSWSCDSSVLAVWIEGDESDISASLFRITTDSLIQRISSPTMDHWKLPLVSRKCFFLKSTPNLEKGI